MRENVLEICKKYTQKAIFNEQFFKVSYICVTILNQLSTLLHVELRELQKTKDFSS